MSNNVTKFSTGSKFFIKGFYTLENQDKNQFWNFVYKKTQIRKVNNSGLILVYFNELPEGSKIIN